MKEVTQKEYEELLKWLFGNDVRIKKEEDITLSPYYEDINIYYTEEIYNLFQTRSLKREGRILQLGSSIFNKPNCYHTRLEHSKGAYRNCLEFLAIHFRNPEWKKYIEDNKLKSYLVEKLKFMCVHDIGHSMFSHSIERLIGDENCTHEDIGNKITHDDEETKRALSKIKADEENGNILGDGSLEFFCEENVDFDRMDYLMRDRMYLGEKDINDLILHLNTMCDLKFIPSERVYRYVYSEEALEYIKQFLKIRDDMYKREYLSKDRNLTDELSSYLIEQINQGKIKNTEKLQEYLKHFVGKKLEEIDIDEYLKTNDLVFLNELIKAMKDEKSVINKIMPDNKTLVQVAIGLLDPKNTDKSKYSEEEKEFIKNVKNLISNRKDNERRIESIIFGTVHKDDIREEIHNRINDILGENKEQKGIYYYKTRIKKYNKKEPIYIESKDNKIYTLDEFSSLQMDLSEDYRYGVYIIVPQLEENGINEEKIDEIKKVIEEYHKQEEINEENLKRENSRMNLFRTESKDVSYIRKMDEFFGDER